MENTGNYLGRCKDCAYVIFATAEDVQQADGSLHEPSQGLPVQAGPGHLQR
jgi:hypothetical protein